MTTLESVFVREFRNAVSNTGYKDIYKIPLPKEVEDWEVSGTDLFKVETEEPYFSNLSGSIVKRLPKNKIARQRVINPVTRNFKRDENGEYEYTDYSIPSGSIVVLSEIQIGLPNPRKYTPSQGYGYIDFNFITKKDGSAYVEYMYVLPKSCLYKIHQTALAMSVKNMKNYEGMGYVTWKNGTIFLHIIPYNPNSQYTGTKILKTGYSLNYQKEIKVILNYWQNSRVIPNLALCTLEDGSNLAMKNTIVGYEEYIPIDTLPLNDKETYTGEEE